MRSAARRPLVLGLAASVAMAAALLLSGCSLIPHGGGGISLPGGISVGSGKLPRDFPSEVPVAKGEVVAGASVGDAAKGKVWNVTIKVGGADAAQQIDAQMTGAGFESTGLGETGDGSGATYTKGAYGVVIVVAKDKDKGDWVANYTVTYDPGSGN